MYLIPNDIACYMYCPLLYSKRKHNKVIPPLGFFEEKLRDAFVLAEEVSCLKDSIVNSRRLHASWDKIWWPAAAKQKIKMKEADELSLKASRKFTDYCKYDISDWFFPTAGVDIEVEKHVNSAVLKASVDVVKVDLNQRKNTVLINFTNRSLSLGMAAIDPIARATAYAFYSGRGETITYISVNINSKIPNVEITTSTFRPESMDDIRKMLSHVQRGIASSSFYPSPYKCKECKQCQIFI